MDLNSVIQPASASTRSSASAKTQYAEKLRKDVINHIGAATKQGRYECHVHSLCKVCTEIVVKELGEKGYAVDVYEDTESNRYLIKIFWSDVSVASAKDLTPSGIEAAEIARQNELLLERISK